MASQQLSEIDINKDAKCILYKDKDGNYTSNHYSSFPYDKEGHDDNGSQDQVNNSFWRLVSNDYNTTLIVPGNLHYYLRNKVNPDKPLEKGWKYVWIPPYQLAFMLAGHTAIRITGTKSLTNITYMGWIDYANPDGHVDSRSIQGSLVTGYEKVQLDSAKFSDTLIEFRDHDNPITAKNWLDVDTTDEKRSEISNMYSKRADYINQIATNMVGVKHGNYTLNDLMKFFKAGEQELIMRFGKENIANFESDDDGIVVKFSIYNDFIYA